MDGYILTRSRKRSLEEVAVESVSKYVKLDLQSLKTIINKRLSNNKTQKTSKKQKNLTYDRQSLVSNGEEAECLPSTSGYMSPSPGVKQNLNRKPMWRKKDTKTKPKSSKRQNTPATKRKPFREILKDTWTSWVEDTDVDDLLKYLIQGRVITHQDYQVMVRKKKTEEGMMQYLLDRLYKRPKECFVRYLKVLRETEREHLIPKEAMIYLDDEEGTTNEEDQKSNREGTRDLFMEETSDLDCSMTYTQPSTSNYRPDRVPNHTAPNSHHDLFLRPYCLVDENLQVNDKVLKALSGLPVEKGLVVVSIVGNYKTGKSYIMTRLAGKKKGFPQNTRSYAETRGIWIWVQEHPMHKDRYLVLLDTEGIGDSKRKKKNYENVIFSLANLFSSMLIFNCKGQVYEFDLTMLSHVTKLSKLITSKETDDDDEADDCYFDFHFPRFLLLLRDYNLEMHNGNRFITPDEYLDSLLMVQDDGDDESDEYYATRRCILKYFVRRNCITIKPPGNNDNPDVSSIDDEDLHAGFVENVADFIHFVLNRTPEKKLPIGLRYNGRMWAEMVSTYAAAFKRALNDPKYLTSINKTIQHVAKSENEKLMMKGLEMYTDKMNSLTLPITDDELFTHHCCFSKMAREYFINRAAFDSENEDLALLHKNIEEKFLHYRKENAKKGREGCFALLDNLVQRIDKKISSKAYVKAGGFKEYEDDMEKLYDEYLQNAKYRTQMENCYLDFLNKRKKIRETLMKTDQDIIEVEKRNIKAKYDAELKKRKENAKKAELERMEAVFKHELRNAGQVCLEEANQGRKIILENMIKKHTDILEHRKQVRNQFLREKSIDEARLMEDQIKKVEEKLSYLRSQLRVENRGVWNRIQEMFSSLFRDHKM